MQPTQRELEEKLFAECKKKNNPNINSIKKLLKGNTNVNAKDGCGFTPLHWAVCHVDKEILEVLALNEIGFDPDDVNAAKNKYVFTQLHKEVVKLLLKAGADIEAKYKDGSTPLFWAGFLGHKEIVELLLKSGADVNAKNEFCETPLHSAVSLGYTEIVELLINSGADVTIKNKFDWTPLHTAASNNQLYIMSKAIRNMIPSDINTNIKNKLINGLESISKEITEKENKEELDDIVKEFLYIELPLAKEAYRRYIAKIYAQGAVGGMFLFSENFQLPLEIGMMIGGHVNPEDSRLARVCKSALEQASFEKKNYQDMIKAQAAEKGSKEINR